MSSPSHARPAIVSGDIEGDLYTFCGTCAFAPVCLPEGYDKSSLAELHCLIEHVGPYEAGRKLFQAGEPFEAVFAVRSGVIKTSMIDDEGNEQVLGFYLPGELVGFDGLYQSRYPCTAVALDVTTVCRFSFPAMATLATRMPGIQQQLFRLMSRDIGRASLLAGDFSADERVAAFLLDLGSRFAARGYSATRFNLTMSRADIASHLRLAAETVSRVLRRFQDEGVIHVERRAIELRADDRLRQMARNILR
jgi:CRP/FNR family transcriptional regulator